MWVFCYKNINKIKVLSLLWIKIYFVNRWEFESFNKLNGLVFEYVCNDFVYSVSYVKELFLGFFFWFIKIILDNYFLILFLIG